MGRENTNLDTISELRPLPGFFDNSSGNPGDNGNSRGYPHNGTCTLSSLNSKPAVLLSRGLHSSNPEVANLYFEEQ